MTEPAPGGPRVQVSPGGSAPPCPACGHRWSLHGNGTFAAWCIGWDGERFCGCRQTNLAAAA